MKDETIPAGRAALQRAIDCIVEAVRPDQIILFGSAARGEAAPNDLDLVVVKSGIERRRPLAMRIHRVLAGVGIPVDVIVATPEDLARDREKPATSWSPLAAALREGRVVYSI